MIPIVDYSSMYGLWQEVSMRGPRRMRIKMRGSLPKFVVPRLVPQWTWKPLEQYEFVMEVENERHRLGDVESYETSSELRPL